MSRQVDATFYAQVEPTFGTRYVQNVGSVPAVKNIRVVAITQTQPGKPRSKCVVVKLTLRFNEEAFLPLSPAAVIEIPDSMVAAGSVIEVVANDGDENATAVAEHLAKIARGE